MTRCRQSGCWLPITDRSPHPDYCSFDCWEIDRAAREELAIRQTGDAPAAPTLGNMISVAKHADDKTRVAHAFPWMDVRAARS